VIPERHGTHLALKRRKLSFVIGKKLAAAFRMTNDNFPLLKGESRNIITRVSVRKYLKCQFVNRKVNGSIFASSKVQL
jgi:hypothetical protein